MSTSLSPLEKRQKILAWIYSLPRETQIMFGVYYLICNTNYHEAYLYAPHTLNSHLWAINIRSSLRDNKLVIRARNKIVAAQRDPIRYKGFYEKMTELLSYSTNYPLHEKIINFENENAF